MSFFIYWARKPFDASVSQQKTILAELDATKSHIVTSSCIQLAENGIKPVFECISSHLCIFVHQLLDPACRRPHHLLRLSFLHQLSMVEVIQVSMLSIKPIDMRDKKKTFTRLLWTATQHTPLKRNQITYRISKIQIPQDRKHVFYTNNNILF